MRITIDITISGRRGSGVSRFAWPLLFDRAETIDTDGYHGGRGVQEWVDETTGLFDAAAVISLAGFHGGTGVTEA